MVAVILAQVAQAIPVIRERANMYNQEDPWAWASQQPVASPLSGSSVQPAQATPAEVVQGQPGIVTSVVKPMIVGKTINKGADLMEKKASPYIEEGITGVSNALGISSAPLAQYGGQMAADGTLTQGAGVLALPEAAATGAGIANASTVAASAAPLGAGVASTIGTAMPYVGAGLLAARLLGIKLF